MPNTDYEAKRQEQITQYQDGFAVYPLAPIFHYWAHTYLREKVAAVFGTQTVTDFYASQFAPLFERHSRPVLVSIGSGDGSQELEIAEHLVAMGLSNFRFSCLELNPILVQAANAAFRRKGIEHLIDASVFDINSDDLDYSVNGFMAHHSLHHIVELERLFDMIDRRMSADSCFVTQDMIGRNGHMLWPESLRFVEAVWKKLPETKRYHHQHKKMCATFENHDCSTFGFEGIRAQDILPLLMQKFSFTKFLGAGGMIDTFVERNFGPNFDPSNAGDRMFIDAMEAINDQMLETGAIKPTMLFAQIVKKKPGLVPRVYGNLTPEHCLRNSKLP